MTALHHQSETPSALLDRIEQNVPRALRELPVWLLYTPQKVPLYANGCRRHGKLDSLEDRECLVRFDDAAAALLVGSTAAIGLGVALGSVPGTDLTISGIDFDNCYRSGNLDERVDRILRSANSYAEESPSGQRLHILGTGDLGRAMKVRDREIGIEIYSQGRYFTVTGNVINFADLAPIHQAGDMARQLFKPTGALSNSTKSAEVIVEGRRNSFLTGEAGKLRRINSDPSVISAVLREVNQRSCVPPVPDTEVEQIARGILRYSPDPADAPQASAVQLLRGSDLNPEPISWLWNGWLARGKLHVLAGAPGCGKTTVALAFAAAVTTGKIWPDGTSAEQGNALIWSGEDDFNDTLLPRLLAMGAERDKIYFVGGVALTDGQHRPFDPAHDMEALADAARKVGDISLMVVDPIVNAVAGDSHKNTETRRALQPLVDLATQLDAALLGISHYTKGTQGSNPVERVTGSIAFGALPRIIMGAARGPGECGSPDRILVRAKSNIGPDGGGYAYSICQEMLPDYPEVVASSVAWGAPLDGSAQELLSTAEAAADGEEPGARSEAVNFLKAELAGGLIASKELTKRAREAGISERTLKRARKTLKIQTRKDGETGAWYCSLPPDFGIVGEEGQEPPPQNIGPLGLLGVDERAAGHTEPQEGQAGQGCRVEDMASLLGSGESNV